MQKVKDEADAAVFLQQQLADSPANREPIDTLLEKLNVLSEAQAELADDDRAVASGGVLVEGDVDGSIHPQPLAGGGVAGGGKGGAGGRFYAVVVGRCALLSGTHGGSGKQP